MWIKSDAAALHDDLHSAECDIPERLAVFERVGWVAALAQTGLTGLTPAAGQRLLAEVRREAAKL